MILTAILTMILDMIMVTELWENLKLWRIVEPSLGGGLMILVILSHGDSYLIISNVKSLVPYINHFLFFSNIFFNHMYCLYK